MHTDLRDDTYLNYISVSLPGRYYFHYDLFICWLAGLCKIANTNGWIFMNKSQKMGLGFNLDPIKV